MLALYRGAMSVLSPAALSWRRWRGKEDPKRLPERRGEASQPRPEGLLIWIHGASVGESLAALPLVESLVARAGRHVLVTTGTRTSAELLGARLPSRALHQYVPIDSVQFARRFLRHWRPDLALFVESELWPNLILETQASRIPMMLVNARLSERSFRGWRRAPGLARRVLSAFDLCLAQDCEVASRLVALGAANVRISGSLKADAPPLPADEAALGAFRAALGKRPLFLAASTHPGEDKAIMEVARALGASHKTVLVTIVPRHPQRGAEIEGLARGLGFSVERRGAGALPGTATRIYVADTMGELGLFYRSAPFAFLGGSLVPHGGQNPLEAARLGLPVIAGPYTDNFREAFGTLFAAQGAGRVRSQEELARLASQWLADPAIPARMGAAARAAAKTLSGALAITLETTESLLRSHARA